MMSRRSHRADQSGVMGNHSVTRLLSRRLSMGYNCTARLKLTPLVSISPAPTLYNNQHTNSLPASACDKPWKPRMCQTRTRVIHGLCLRSVGATFCRSRCTHQQTSLQILLSCKHSRPHSVAATCQAGPHVSHVPCWNGITVHVQHPAPTAR